MSNRRRRKVHQVTNINGSIPPKYDIQRSDSPTILKWKGMAFRLAPKVGVMPFLALAATAEEGADSNDMAAMTAMFNLLKNCLDDRDWKGFQAHATKIKADGDELMEFVSQVMEKLAGRPTKQSSDSSPGQIPSKENSEDDATARVLSRLEGRPDLQLTVLEAQEAQASIG